MIREQGRRILAFGRSQGWVGLVGLGLLGSIVTVGLQAAIAPEVAVASTLETTVSLTRQGTESYQTLLRRAEAIARVATQQSFDADTLVTEVIVTIVVENNDRVAPVLQLQVERTQWRTYPDPQLWITYYPTAPSLLGIDATPLASPATPPTAPSSSTSSTPPTGTPPSATTGTPSTTPTGTASDTPTNTPDTRRPAGIPAAIPSSTSPVPTRETLSPLETAPSSVP